MNKTIWKFPIKMATDFALEIPFGYKVLHVGVQHATHDAGPFFWAEVNPAGDTGQIHFAVVGTGHDIPVKGKYLGTWLSDDFVWHLYQREI